jgi:hypothetical protein
VGSGDDDDGAEVAVGETDQRCDFVGGHGGGVDEDDDGFVAVLGS